jgi:hypothetical protein
MYNELPVGFGMKNLEFYGVNLHGLDPSHLHNTLNEYYFPVETLSEAQDLEGTVHSGFNDMEVLRLLKELGTGNRSVYEFESDQSQILAYDVDPEN